MKLIRKYLNIFFIACVFASFGKMPAMSLESNAMPKALVNCKSELERVCKAVGSGYKNFYSKEDINKLYRHEWIVDLDDDRSAMFTPLQYACFEGDFDAVKALILEGADVNKEVEMADKGNDYIGMAAIHIAIFKKHVKILKALIGEKNVDKEKAISAGWYSGLKSIHLAALSGDCELINICLEAGLDKEAFDSNGHEAVLWAMTSGEKAVGLFLEAGVNIEKFFVVNENGVVEFVPAIQIHTSDQISPLFILARECDEAIKKVDGNDLLEKEEKVIRKIRFIIEKKEQLLKGRQVLPALSEVKFSKNQKHFLLLLRRMLSLAIDNGDFELVKAIIEANFVKDLNLYRSQLRCSLANAILKKDIRPFKSSVFVKIFESNLQLLKGEKMWAGKGKELLKQVFEPQVVNGDKKRVEKEVLSKEENMDSKRFAKKMAKHICICNLRDFVEEERMKELTLKSKIPSDCDVFVI